MNEILIYTTQYCGYCHRAKAVLEHKGLAYTEIAVDGDRVMRAELLEKTGQRTVPQIWINDQHVGGCTELMSLDYSGKLDAMLR